MTIIEKDVSIEGFDAWHGGEVTKEAIINADKVSEFDAWIEEQYPDGLTATELNDILWFNDEKIFEDLGIEEEDEDEEE